MENSYEKNDAESKDLASFFFYLKTLESTEDLQYQRKPPIGIWLTVATWWFFYVEDEYGGAWQTMKYAEKQNI
ncbi:MAG: hypothetical protein Q4D35_00255 [Ruminococcus sp.]|nr:hypothetical protein [Ruminococcus sp.]